MKMIQVVINEKVHILEAATISILKAIRIGPKVLCSRFWELALDEEFNTCEIGLQNCWGIFHPLVIYQI